MRSRIVSTGPVALAALRVVPRKSAPRRPRWAEAALRESIQRLGFFRPILVQAGSMRVVDGRLRVEVAKSLGFTEVPAHLLDLSDAEAERVAEEHDRIAALAFADPAMLRELSGLVAGDPLGDLLMGGLLAGEPSLGPAYDPASEPNSKHAVQPLVYCSVGSVHDPLEHEVAVSRESYDEFVSRVGATASFRRAALSEAVAKAMGFGDHVRAHQ